MRFWIRVNARLADDPEVIAFAVAILPKLPVWVSVRTACGLLVTLWGHVVDEQEDGDLSGRDDVIVEAWAGWGGKRNLFAREFRQRFTENGQIRQWEEYQGKLIERRERDRTRKRGGKSAGIPQETPDASAGVPPEVARPPVGHVHGHEHGQALVSAPYSAERQEPTPGSSPAPEGAAPAVVRTGNYLTAPGAVEALLRRGVRIEQIDRTPHGTLAELTDQQEFTRIEYEAEMARSVAGWIAMNPDATAELEQEARASLGLRPGDLSQLKRDALRASMAELIRQREKWPTLDTWDRCEFGLVASHA